jgi:hypothetical protein
MHFRSEKGIKKATVEGRFGMDLGFLFAFSVDVSSESVGVNGPSKLLG